MFAGCSGGTTTCEHSQELTSGLLVLEVTAVLTASMLFTAVRPFENHTNGGGLSSYGSSRGPFLQSYLRQARKLGVRLEKYAHLLAGIFFI